MSNPRKGERPVPHSDDDEESSYTLGSDVPPPPSYSEAITKGLTVSKPNDQEEAGSGTGGEEGATIAEGGTEEGKANQQGILQRFYQYAVGSSGDEVPEGSIDRLRQKRIDFYTRGQSPEPEEENEDEVPHSPLVREREEIPSFSRAGIGLDHVDAEDTRFKTTVTDDDNDLPQIRVEIDDQRGAAVGKPKEDDVENYDTKPPLAVEEEVDGISELDSGTEYSSVTRERIEQFEIAEADPEAARRSGNSLGSDNYDRRRRRRPYDVGSMSIPFLRSIINGIVRRIQRTKDNWPEYSTQKRFILIFSIFFVVGLVLLVSLLPPSFVYVDYDKMGFLHNRLTGQTDHGHVYDYGCYLMAPQHKMVLFPATARFVDLNLAVMNINGLTIGLDVSLQYVLRRSELSQLYRRYDKDYNVVVKNMAESTVKNMATQFTLDELRLNRSMVERRIYSQLLYRLSGDCCRSGAQKSTFDKAADFQCYPPPNCNQGLHVDIIYFQLGALTIPKQVREHYLQQIVLQVELEKEEFIQEAAVERKLTELSVQMIGNEAKEIKEAAWAKRHKILTVAEASKLRVLELSFVSSLKKVYTNLSLTSEDDKTSLLYLNTLKNKKDNLVAFSYNYEKETLYSP